jgi:branched-chain amino acid aminotransferase
LKAGYDESIMLNTQGMVSEASAENVFRVKDGIVSTPPASAGVLRGITRDTIIRVVPERGGNSDERTFRERSFTLRTNYS